MLVLFLSPLFAKCQIWLFNENPASPNAHLTFNFVKDLIVLVIVFLLTALTFMWEQRQKTRLENQRLLTENLQNRYDVLKNQVDPHFLFNSLNTLNGLIGYDDDKAHEYVDQLSLVFRHTMHNKEILSLSEELDFTMSYIYLMKIRYNDSLQLITNIDDLYLDYYILPCGLQLLIENAIKHNIVSNKYPLEVTIETSGHDTILVRNNIRRKPEVEAGSGVGLANLNERYRLLFRKEIIIKDMDGIFSVEVPLIKEKEKPKVIQDESYYCRR
ncbi:MAG: histidine kinase [Bacteroidales bacterium]|nr:histidine kinase [Bacteroidales bacterium]